MPRSPHRLGDFERRTTCAYASLGDFLGDNCSQMLPTGAFWTDLPTEKHQVKPYAATGGHDRRHFTSASLCRLSYSGLYSYELGLCSWLRLAYMVRGPALETIGNKAAVKGDTEQRGG